MRILMVTEFFPTGKALRFSGGVEARTYFVAKHLKKRHNKVIVLCSRQPGSSQKEKLHGIEIFRVGPKLNYNSGNGRLKDSFTMAKFIIEAIKYGSKIDAEIVDGGDFIAHLIAKEIARLKKIPVVFWYPDVFVGQWIKTSGIISGIAGFALEKINMHRRADHFIAISQTTKEKLIKNGILKEKVTIIPCGVEKEEFEKRIENLNRIICVSRLVKYKRVEDLIWSFALVAKIDPQLSLLLVGRGPEEKNLKKIIKMLKINKRIRFLSNLKREDLISRIKASKILCLPSEVEGFGIVVIEAAMAGVPYVVSDIPVLKEITKNGKGGLIFKVADIKDLAKKLEKLLTNEKLYENKSKEATSLAKSYQWPKITQQTEEVYKKAFVNFEN